MVLIAALTLLPALLGFSGNAIDKLHLPGLLQSGGPPPPNGFWHRWSRLIQRRAWVTGTLAVLVLVLLALPLFSMRLAFTDASNDPSSTTTKQAYDLLAQGFGIGFNGPLVVAVDMHGPQDRAVVERLGQALGHGVPDVAYAAPPRFNATDTGAVVIVVPTTSPQAAQTENLVQDLRSNVIPPVVSGTDVNALVGGQTAGGIDAANFLGSRLFLVIGAVLILSFVLLMTVFRSLVLPLKAVIMNLLSVGAAYGVMVAVFQWGWAGSVIGVGETGPIDPWIPVTMFTILFGLSMDYEVFLLSRIREEWLRTGVNSEAVADGLAVTGRIITAAAAIMFCVFASFVINDPLHILRVFGLGLAAAVLIDATLVRMVLVPSIMEILGPRELVDAALPPTLHPDHRGGGHADAGPLTESVRRLNGRWPPFGVRAILTASLDPCTTNRSPLPRSCPSTPGATCRGSARLRFLGEDVRKIHDPVWAVIGNLGDSQCYLGVPQKVEAVQAALSRRIAQDDLAVRLIPPAFTLGVSDGQLNGTPQMRFSLVGRELVHDVVDVHLAANGVAGLVAVVACDKPPVGTVAAVLENNTPAVILSDGPIRPGIDPETGARIDLVSAFQVVDQDAEVRARYALHACPGQGSCGGMFTYNTMQTFIAVLGLEPLHMVSPPSDDPRRLTEFPDQTVDCLLAMTKRGIRPRDIVTPSSLRNALTVTIAMGGSTNVLLHSVEIARAAGHRPVGRGAEPGATSTQLARRLPVLVNMRPFGDYSMVDVDAKGGLQVIVNELLEAGFLDGDAMTCTGETLAEQLRRLDPPAPDQDVIYLGRASRSRTPAGCVCSAATWLPRAVRSSRSPASKGGVKDGVFTGRAHVFNGERSLIEALDEHPDSFQDNDMVVIRYEGPRGAPGMPELLDPDLAHHGPLPPAAHHHRPDDRRSLLGRIGRSGHRPRRPRSIPRGADRARRGRRHHRGRPDDGSPRLRAARRTGRVRATSRGLAGGGRGQRRRPPRRGAGDGPGAGADAGDGAPRPPRRGHGDACAT